MSLKRISTSVLLSIMITMSAASLSNANEVNQSIQPSEVNQASTRGYTAPNDTKSINLNQNNVFRVDKNNDTEWCKFTVTENGYITLDIDKALFAGNVEGNLEVIIQDESGKYEYLKSRNNYTKLGNSTKNTWKIGLKPGTYYMRLYSYFSTGDSYMDLSYKVGFTKHDYFETEGYLKNINLNTKYSGIMHEDGQAYWSNDTDDYIFNVNENGHYIFNINHGLNKEYIYEIIDRYDRTVASFSSSSMNGNDGRNYSYTLKNITPGEYKLEIYSSSAIQDEYTFSLNKAKEGWVKESGAWYYYKEGVKQTDWQTIDGKEYFFDSTGKMKTGWFNDYGTWYYLSNSGAKQKGWLNLGGTWYYLSEEDGDMQTGLQYIDGHTYYFNNNGAMFNKGWKKIDGRYYYFNQGGSAKTGWIKENSNWYYLDYDGEMVKGLQYIDGKTYFFNSEGVMYSKPGWKNINGSYYYFNSNGTAKTGWYKEGSTWYYLYSDGEMATGKVKIGGASYIFSDYGKMRTGWINYYGETYYANSNGALKRGWYKEKGKWYYFHGTNNYMLTNGWWLINGIYNYFDGNGVWLGEL